MATLKVAAPRRPAVSFRSFAAHCSCKFLRFFARGFRDGTYLSWERGYKCDARAMGNRIGARHVRRAPRLEPACRGRHPRRPHRVPHQFERCHPPNVHTLGSVSKQ